MGGCYGNVDSYFISRQIMPEMCGSIGCFRMNACFRASFKAQTGIAPKPGFSYLIITPKWRIRST